MSVRDSAISIAASAARILALIFACVPPRALAAQDSARVQLPPSRTVARAPSRTGAARFETCPLDDGTCVPPLVAREFRGVWVATVDNIDWPSRPGLSVSKAKRELIVLLDRAHATGLNAVVFQVRPAGDALYRSSLEPFSEYLTGRQGRVPSPMWDPLAFAVTEAHKRGMELHAWFNPYRARHPSAKGRLSSMHLARKRPGLVKEYGTHLWMDPGEPEVRAQTVRVVVDVVRRYDIDGVHLDDYFYPYKERGRNGDVIDFPDSPSYRRYVSSGGTLGREDWRRQNVDLLVEQLDHAIHRAKPWVKFGVSPFGIWRPGNPEQIRGFDAYAELYADARKWLRAGWVDYFTPQLYWPIAQQPQAYPVLLRWWAEENEKGRNLWPGNYTSRVGERSRTAWDANEVLAQVDSTRSEAGASGNVHFSMKAFLEDRDSLSSRLAAGAYASVALVPESPWLAVAPQGEPRLELRRASRGAFTLRIAPAGKELPRWWLVQLRKANGAWETSLIGGTMREIPIAAGVDRVAVRAVDGASVEGPLRVMRTKP